MHGNGYGLRIRGRLRSRIGNREHHRMPPLLGFGRSPLEGRGAIAMVGQAGPGRSVVHRKDKAIAIGVAGGQGKAQAVARVDRFVADAGEDGWSIAVIDRDGNGLAITGAGYGIVRHHELQAIGTGRRVSRLPTELCLAVAHGLQGGPRRCAIHLEAQHVAVVGVAGREVDDQREPLVDRAVADRGQDRRRVGRQCSAGSDDNVVAENRKLLADLAVQLAEFKAGEATGIDDPEKLRGGTLQFANGMQLVSIQYDCHIRARPLTGNISTDGLKNLRGFATEAIERSAGVGRVIHITEVRIGQGCKSMVSVEQTPVPAMSRAIAGGQRVNRRKIAGPGDVPAGYAHCASGKARCVPVRSLETFDKDIDAEGRYPIPERRFLPTGNDACGLVSIAGFDHGRGDGRFSARAGCTIFEAVFPGEKLVGNILEGAVCADGLGRTTRTTDVAELGRCYQAGGHATGFAVQGIVLEHAEGFDQKQAGSRDREDIVPGDQYPGMGRLRKEQHGQRCKGFPPFHCLNHPPCPPHIDSPIAPHRPVPGCCRGQGYPPVSMNRGKSNYRGRSPNQEVDFSGFCGGFSLPSAS